MREWGSRYLKGLMRYGDWIVILSMTLNGGAALLYAYQGYWLNAGYWASALSLNFFLLHLK